jgi:hypothetical protein
MKIAEIKNLVRKDVPIYYRRLFTGIIVVDLINETVERNINFTVETKPSGVNEVIINELESIEYPLLPLTKAIKNHISVLDESGGLPK